MKKGIDYIGVGVGAVVKNNGGKYFLSKRSQTAKNEAGTWEFPGGGVDYGETLEAAIVREMKEEYDVDITIAGNLGTFNHILPLENQHWVGVTFFAEIVRGEVMINEPDSCDEIGWFTLDEIAQMNISQITQKNLKLLQIQGK